MGAGWRTQRQMVGERRHGHGGHHPNVAQPSELSNPGQPRQAVRQFNAGVREQQLCGWAWIRDALTALPANTPVIPSRWIGIMRSSRVLPREHRHDCTVFDPPASSRLLVDFGTDCLLFHNCLCSCRTGVRSQFCAHTRHVARINGTGSRDPRLELLLHPDGWLDVCGGMADPANSSPGVAPVNVVIVWPTIPLAQDRNVTAGGGCETRATVIRSVWPTTSKPAAIPTGRCARYAASGRATLHLSAPVAIGRRTTTPKTCARPATNGSENMAIASTGICDHDRIEIAHRRALGPSC